MKNSTKAIRVECVWSPKSLIRETYKYDILLSQWILPIWNLQNQPKPKLSAIPLHILLQRNSWHQLERPAHMSHITRPLLNFLTFNYPRGEQDNKVWSCTGKHKRIIQKKQIKKRLKKFTLSLVQDRPIQYPHGTYMRE